MPHVTFFHGIQNKPPAEALHQRWLRDLATGGFDLGGEGVTSAMVYWADVLYGAPLNPLAPTTESTADTNVADTDGDLPGAPFASAEERAFVEGLSAKLDLAADDARPPGPPADPALERVPLPWWVKRRVLRALVRDAHHYLFDVEHEPRPGTRYRVRAEIRRRALDAFRRAPGDGPHVVVGHSLGSVIAYDVLKRADGCPPVDALLTLGSPLGIDEVQDRLQPEWTRPDGFPSGTVRDRWVNVSDPLDVVCLLDPTLSGDFRRAGAAVVEDLAVSNDGPSRHAFGAYARQPVLVGRLADLLGT